MSTQSFAGVARSVVIVEDDPAALKLTSLALQRINVNWDARAFSAGGAALQYLRDCGDCGQLPDVVLLDWNLPDLHGRDVLSRVRAASGELRGIRVVVVTTSSAESDIVEARNLGANDYLVKIPDFCAFQHSLGEVLRAEVASPSSWPGVWRAATSD